MATVAAMRCDPPVAALYRRLPDAGKPPKLAITAFMRKLVTILRDHRPRLRV